MTKQKAREASYYWLSDIYQSRFSSKIIVVSTNFHPTVGVVWKKGFYGCDSLYQAEYWYRVDRPLLGYDQGKEKPSNIPTVPLCTQIR
ncbi:hypothetical protein TNCV_3613591 [Trichonephila clavipes]|uniref:Uncharacterized protein n=1 Tax=Trichonephila clavipes TaxID=2585209 RepID=A0A8X6SM90_TRICX|nr:hypothetical protein TNCV_3613591 [Trichonephila clavipes]